MKVRLGHSRTNIFDTVIRLCDVAHAGSSQRPMLPKGYLETDINKRRRIGKYGECVGTSVSYNRPMCLYCNKSANFLTK